MEAEIKIKEYVYRLLPEYIDNKSKRIHTSFLLAATNTGRLASADPIYKTFQLNPMKGKKLGQLLLRKKVSQLFLLITVKLK